MRRDRHEASVRRVCFVTGTRAEFGLMRSVLRAIQASPKLKLQIVATGMHLDASRGRSVEQIEREGWRVDAVVPWSGRVRPHLAWAPRPCTQIRRTGEAPVPRVRPAVATGLAAAGLAAVYEQLASDIVVVVGDRVEAFAAATAAHLSGRVVAHVHGGDRALGQVDDSLRHAITKLAHVHFPATVQSARRIARMGEDCWRIHRVGSPGIDGIRREAVSGGQLKCDGFDLRPRSFALLVLHPVDADADVEHRRATTLLRATRRAGFDRVVIVYPNNDPGGEGIVRAWREISNDPGIIVRPNLAGATFLGLMRDAAVLVGNSSSGIIEAASFGTPVVDVGPRQLGRERSGNVVSVAYAEREVYEALSRIWIQGSSRRYRGANVYGGARRGGGSAAERITRVLSDLRIDQRLLRKLIAY
jgi:GDP/UDP-N,N'-diacetylbacillosamine 2-epimerase (hydrolysing)